MNEKKKRIIESAVKLFAKKGFHFTSMQEIAWKLGMSKGALYLQFSSKEDLLLSIMQYYQDEVFERIDCINQDDGLSAKEKLVKQIEIQFAGFQENQDFIKLHIKEQLNPKSYEVREFMERAKARIFYWQKEALLAVYGGEIRPYLWDLVLIFHGIVGEYRRLILIEKQPVDIRDAAQLIVESLDGVVVSLSKQAQGVVTADMMPGVGEDQEEEWPSFQEMARDCLERMQQQIEHAHVEKGMKKEMRAAILCLEKEVFQEQPRKFLLHSLVGFLEPLPMIQGETRRLKRLISQRYPI